MRAVMALAAQRAGAASRRRPSRRARRRRSCASPRCCNPISAPRRRLMLEVASDLDLFHGDAQALDGVSLAVEEGRSSPSSAPTAPARPRSSAPSPACIEPRRGDIRFAATKSPAGRAIGCASSASARWPRAGRCFPTLTVRRIWQMGAMLPRGARQGRARNLERVAGMFPRAGRARCSRRPARCRAASSRCWRSAAA